MPGSPGRQRAVPDSRWLSGRPSSGAGPAGGDFGNMAEYTRLQNCLALIRLRNPPVNAIR